MAVNLYPKQESTRPHTGVSVNSDSLSSATAGSEKAVVLFGSAEGGEPGTLYRLSNLPQARNIFAGGELLDAIELAWTPSNTQSGAGIIYAMRVDSAKQATLKVQGLNIESKQYGTIANQVAVSLKQDPTTSAYTFTVTDARTGKTETYENLGDLFTITYTGKGKAAVAEVKSGVLTVTVDDVVYATFTLGKNGLYKTVGQLVNAINADEYLKAAINIYANRETATDNIFDVELGSILKTPVAVTSVTASLLYRVAFSNLIDVTATGTKDLEAIPQTQLTGGTVGTVPTSWTNMFGRFLEQDAPLAYYLVAVTPDLAIHKELRKIVKESSDIGYSLRAIVGSGFEVSINELLQRRAELAEQLVSMSGFSAEVRMNDGRLLLAPPYMTAVMIAGIASGLPVGEPLTFKNLRIESIKTFDAPYTSEELDLLFESGVITAEKSRNRAAASFRISSEVTTTNLVEEPVARYMGLGESTDFLANRIRVMLDDTFIGTRTSLVTPGMMITAISQELGMEQLQGNIVDYDKEQIQVIIRNRTARINFSVQPTQGIDFINVGISYRNDDIVSQ